MSERARQPSRRIDAPEPGWFRLRLARARSPLVGARIYTRLGQLVAEIERLPSRTWTRSGPRARPSPRRKTEG